QPVWRPQLLDAIFESERVRSARSRNTWKHAAGQRPRTGELETGYRNNTNLPVPRKSETRVPRRGVQRDQQPDSGKSDQFTKQQYLRADSHVGRRQGHAIRPEVFLLKHSGQTPIFPSSDRECLTPFLPVGVGSLPAAP